MGFFGDTLRDTRRPLPAGGWLRRSPAVADADAPAIEEEAVDEPSDGMQTVFRFQKAEPPAVPGRLREASYRSGAAENRPPAGDPSTAGTDADGPMSTASDVGMTDMTVQGDRRGSSLETGQEERASPDKVEAAQAESGSSGFQSSETSVHTVSEQYRPRRQSTNENGSERPDSRSEETFLRGVAGRGAPSETHDDVPFDAPFARAAARPGVPAVPAEARAIVGAPLAAAAAEGARRREAPRMPARGASDEAVTGMPSMAGLRPAEAPRHRPRAGPTASTPEPLAAGQAPRVAAGWDTPPARAAEPAPAPALSIGRIEVVVVAAPPVPAPAAARVDSGFMSRNYLRRL
jgi:hypothetical protein